MDSTNIVTPTVTAVPRNEKTMHGEDFSSLTGSSFDRQFLLFFRFLSKLSFQRQPDSFQRESDQKGCPENSRGHIVCVGNNFTVAKIVCCFNNNGCFYSGFVQTMELYFWQVPCLCPAEHGMEIYPTEMFWKLTPIVWSNSLVIAHLKTIENRRYVHLWYENINVINKREGMNLLMLSPPRLLSCHPDQGHCWNMEHGLV